MADDDSKPKKRKYEVEGPPPKDTTDFFRQRINHMIKNIDKPMVIPQRPQDKKAPKAKEFFPNVMGKHKHSRYLAFQLPTGCD
jgi:hypothetical protein